MEDKTPEETLEGLLALGEKATEGEWFANNMAVGTHPDARAGYPPTRGTVASLFDGEYIENDNYQNDAAFIAASKNALPALRSLLEEVKGLSDTGKALAMLALQSDRYRDDPEYRDATDALLSRLGGK